MEKKKSLAQVFENSYKQICKFTLKGYFNP